MALLKTAPKIKIQRHHQQRRGIGFICRFRQHSLFSFFIFDKRIDIILLVIPLIISYISTDEFHSNLYNDSILNYDKVPECCQII